MTLVYNTDNMLSNFPPCLRKHFEICLRNQIGLVYITLHDISIPNNRSLDSSYSNYHFIFKIPYAGKMLKWDIIFDPENFNFAPDFDFNDDEFMNDPDLKTVMKNVPSIGEWELKNPQSLNIILNELLMYYKKTQIEKMQRKNIYSRYCEEYEILVTKDVGVDPENVEIYIDSSTITFLIALKVDCTALPDYIQNVSLSHGSWYNPGEDFAHLKISILKLDGSRSTLTLQLSPRLEQILGNSKYLELPEIKKDTPIVEQVAMVNKVIDDRIETIANHFRMKKVYLACFVAACIKSIVEYDTENFDNIMFMHSIKDYDCLVTVKFGPKFPQEKPIVQLTSIYCQEGKQCIETINSYPYNVNLNPEVNIENLLESLDSYIQIFKNHAH